MPKQTATSTTTTTNPEDSPLKQLVQQLETIKNSLKTVLGELGAAVDVVKRAEKEKKHAEKEIEAIRETCGREFLIVTPGVRTAGSETHDQARVATPAAAIRAGADYLGLGRATLGPPDPRAAARAVADEIQTTLG